MTIPMTHSGSEKRIPILLTWYTNVLTEFMKDQTGYASIAIIGQSCLGSAAVMLLLMHEIPMMVKMTFIFLITIFCLAFNAAVLVHLKSKLMFNILIISVLMSSSVIIANLF